MKQNWQIDPVPPPENSASGMDGFISMALLAFAIVGPLIYFGDELGGVETMVAGWYGTLEILAAADLTFGSSDLRGGDGGLLHAISGQKFLYGSDYFAPPRAGLAGEGPRLISPTFDFPDRSGPFAHIFQLMLRVSVADWQEVREG